MKRRSLLNAVAGLLKEQPAEPSALLERVRHAGLDVPAYRSFLSAHGLAPKSLLTVPWADLPVMTKENYIRVYSLEQRCLYGSLAEADTFAVSSGTTGAPTVWPRSLVDELESSFPFESVLRNFEADRLQTLVVIAFPLGIWIGGMHSTSTLRLIAAKGFPISIVSPGANIEEIVRTVGELAANFEQVVLVGYPPFIRDVLAGELSGNSWTTVAPRLIFAGESFTEEWRDRAHTLSGHQDPLYSSASVYGTADAGVLAFETPDSIQIRRLVSNYPRLCEQLFGQQRIPALMQYNETHVYFEEHRGELLFSKLGTMPLVRYNIGDSGGTYTPATLSARLQEAVSAGVVSCSPDLISAIHHSQYPFVFLFGRSDTTVSFFGANIYAEHISSAINKSEMVDRLTGRFYMETFDSTAGEKQLRIVVEAKQGITLDDNSLDSLRQYIEETLRIINSEYKNYVPKERQQIVLKLVPFGDDALFSRKGKQKYSSQTPKSEGV